MGRLCNNWPFDNRVWSLPLLFSFQAYFDNSVLFAYFLSLHLCLNVTSVSPFIFISAIISLLCIFEIVANNLSIMSLDNAGHIFHAAVAYFYSVLFKILWNLWFFGKCISESRKNSYVYLNVFIEWWVKPNNFSFSVFPLVCSIFSFCVWQFLCVSTKFQSLIIIRLCFFKNFSVGR